MNKIDLHIHTTYSDGTYSPKEIIALAKEKKLTKIAISDHNEYRGSKEAFILEPDLVIPAVEIDTTLDNIRVHILAYNIDFANEKFMSFLDQNRDKLFALDDNFIDCLINNNYNIDLEDFKNYNYDKSRGGWKALNYIIDKGYIKDINEYFELVKKYHYEEAFIKFLHPKEVIDLIHEVNAIAVLAHPYKTFPKDKLDYYLNLFRDYKIDGIECYYYNICDKLVKRVEKFCKDNDLITTVGSDYHGNFTKSNLGFCDIDYHSLNLGKLIK